MKKYKLDSNTNFGMAFYLDAGKQDVGITTAYPQDAGVDAAVIHFIDQIYLLCKENGLEFKFGEQLHNTYFAEKK